MNTGGSASCRESGALQPKCNYHRQNRRAYFIKKGHGSKIISMNGDVAALAGLVSLEHKRPKKHDGRDHSQKPVHFDVREG
jgi:hypothetical protein